MSNENDKENEGLAGEVVGRADLSKGAMHPVDPNTARLSEELSEGMVIRGYCSNCGSYPEYGQEDAQRIALMWRFVLPSKEEIKNYYISIDTCPVCDKKADPNAEVKKFS